MKRPPLLHYGNDPVIRWITIAALAVLLLSPLAGCASLSPAVKLDNSARLMARPDFQAAKTAAPEWSRDALLTINALELEIERRK